MNSDTHTTVVELVKVAIAAAGSEIDIICITNSRADTPGKVCVQAHNINPAELHDPMMTLAGWCSEMLLTRCPAGFRHQAVRLVASTMGKTFCRGFLEAVTDTNMSREQIDALLTDTLDTIRNVITTCTKDIQ